MILSDKDIRKLCVGVETPMISPFSEGSKEKGVVSYGLSSAGYDLRLAPEIWEVDDDFRDKYSISPLVMKHTSVEYDLYTKLTCNHVYTIKPRGSILARSMEYLTIPRNLVGICVGKSSWARCFIIVNTTPAEPMWKGYLTIEITNMGTWPVDLFIGQGIAQMQFITLSSDPEVSYADKGGIYQDQTGVTASRIR